MKSNYTFKVKGYSKPFEIKISVPWDINNCSYMFERLSEILNVPKESILLGKDKGTYEDWKNIKCAYQSGLIGKFVFYRIKYSKKI